MILTKEEPFTEGEIESLKEEFGSYIKTVIDIKKRVCSSGASRHFESEQILLKAGSNQADIWGGGLDLETKEIDYNSFINIRPNHNNTSNEIQDPKIRQEYKQTSQYFFKAVL